MACKAADRICGKRLKALLAAMDRHGHLVFDAALRLRLLTMSAATIDRALVDQWTVGGRKRRRLGPSSAVPVRTFFAWGDPAPASPKPTS